MVVVEPAVAFDPIFQLGERVGRVLHQAELGGSVAAVVADGAAEGLERVRTGVAHHQVQPRVGAVRMRQAAAHLKHHRFVPVPPGQQQLAGMDDAGDLDVVDVFDHVPLLQSRPSSKRRRHHELHRSRVRLELPLRGDAKSVGLHHPLPSLGRIVLYVELHLGGAELPRLRRTVTRSHREPARRAFQRQRDASHAVLFGISWLGGAAGSRAVNRHVAGTATVEAGHLLEVEVDLQIGQPTVVNLHRRVVERIENRQPHDCLAQPGPEALLSGQRLFQPLYVQPQAFQRPVGRAGDGIHGSHQNVQVFAEGVQPLVATLFLLHVGQHGVDLLLELGHFLLAGPLVQPQPQVASYLVQLGPGELQFQLGQLLLVTHSAKHVFHLLKQPLVGGLRRLAAEPLVGIPNRHAGRVAYGLF